MSPYCPPSGETVPPGDLACELCGRPDARLVGGRSLCPACYQLGGACCPEFGAWDAWTEVLNTAPPERKPLDDAA